MEGIQLALQDNAEKGRTTPTYSYDKTERVIEAVILCFISAAALIGNTSLWIIILRSKRLKTCSNYLILCLSTADILVSGINMPVAVYTILAGDWEFSDSACTVLGFITMLTFVTSVMSLGAISINRYVMVCHPRKLHSLYTPKRTGIWIAGVWILSFCLATPPLIGWAEYGYLPGQSFCFCRWTTSISYTFFMVATCFGGPCSTMTFCYVNILREVRRSKKRVMLAQARSNMSPTRAAIAAKNADKENEVPESEGETQNQQPVKEKGRFYKLTRLLSRKKTPTSNHNGIKYTMSDINGLSGRPSSPRRTSSPDDGASMISQGDDRISSAAKRRKEKHKSEELRLTTSLFVVIIVFTICWLPFCVTMFLSVFQSSPVPRIPDISTMLLGCLNSSCNPIIYGLMNRKFRAGFAALYCWSCRAIKQRQQTSSSIPKSSSSNTN